MPKTATVCRGVSECLACFDQSGYGHSLGGRRMIIPAQMALGMYDEAMATSDEVVYRMGRDTINDDYAVILRDRAIVARAKGHVVEAYNLMNRHANLVKVLSDSLHASEAHDYAARYHFRRLRQLVASSRSSSVLFFCYSSSLVPFRSTIVISAWLSTRKTVPWYV